MSQPGNTGSREPEDEYMSSETAGDYDPMRECPNNDPYSFNPNNNSQTNHVRERDYSDYAEFGEEVDPSAVEDCVRLLDS